MAESKRFLLRLNPDLFEALRRWADDDLRSINAQIEFLLADQARRAGRLPAKRAKSSPNADRVRSSSNGAGDGKSSTRSGRKRSSRARTQA